MYSSTVIQVSYYTIPRMHNACSTHTYHVRGHQTVYEVVACSPEHVDVLCKTDTRGVARNIERGFLNVCACDILKKVLPIPKGVSRNP